VGKLLRAPIIDRLRVRLSVTGSEPDQTAVQYGKTCALLYPAQAVLESNMPIGVFLKYRDGEIEGIYAANDTDKTVEGELRLVLTDSAHNTISDTVYGVNLDADGAARIADAPDFKVPADGVVHAYLTLKQNGRMLVKNHYHDVLTIRPPVRLKNLITHEQGLRVFDNE
jgi:hypothetical protein